MRKNTRFQAYGLESVDAVAEVDVATLPPEEETAEAVADAASEVEMHEENINEMEDTAVALESIADGMRAVLATGRGLSMESAAFALQHADRELGRLNMEAVAVSMEEFQEPVTAAPEPPAEPTEDNPTSAEPDAEPVTDSEDAGIQEGAETDRLEATKAALESISDQIKTIWQAIVNAFNKARAALKKFFVSLFDLAPRLAQKARDLKARAAEVSKEKVAGDKSVSISKYVKAIHVDGKVPSFKTVASEVDAVVRDVYVDYPKAAQAYGKSAAKYLAAADLSRNVALISTIGDINQLKLPKLVTAKEAVKNAPEGTEVTSTKELPGGKVLKQIVTKGAASDGTTKDIPVVKFVLEDTEKGEKFEMNDNVEVGALGIIDINLICDMVAGTAMSISQYRRGYEAADKVKSELVAAGDKLSGKTKDAGADVKQADVNKLLQLPRYAGEALDAPAAKVSGWALKTCKALLGAVETSLKAYEPGKGKTAGA